MLMKIVSLFLVCMIINLAVANVAYAGDSDKVKGSKRAAKIASRTAKGEAKIRKLAAEIKAGVKKLGIGKNSVVKVKLRDKRKVKGHISQISETSFTVIDRRGNATVIEYTKAKQIKGNNLHAGVWVAIGVGIAVAAIFIILAIIIDD